MKFNQRLISAFVALFLILLIGTVYFHQAEKWSYIDSFYFSTMTLTTVGYGDLVPTTNASKLFVSFYAIFGIGTMLYIISTIIGKFVFRQEKRIEKIFRKIYPKKAKKIGKVSEQKIEE